MNKGKVQKGAEAADGWLRELVWHYSYEMEARIQKAFSLVLWQPDFEIDVEEESDDERESGAVCAGIE